MKTSEDVHELGLFKNDCCSQELIFDQGDTFWRCPRCHHLCCWELEAKITKDPELSKEGSLRHLQTARRVSQVPTSIRHPSDSRGWRSSIVRAPAPNVVAESLR